MVQMDPISIVLYAKHSPSARRRSTSPPTVEHGFLPCGLAACCDEAKGNTPTTTTASLGRQLIVIFCVQIFRRRSSNGMWRAGAHGSVKFLYASRHFCADQLEVKPEDKRNHWEEVVYICIGGWWACGRQEPAPKGGPTAQPLD